MSSDNYVIVRKFGESEYRWMTFAASNDPQDTSDEVFLRHHWGQRVFVSEIAAARDAERDLCVIEYGFRFDTSKNLKGNQNE